MRPTWVHRYTVNFWRFILSKMPHLRYLVVDDVFIFSDRSSTPLPTTMLFSDLQYLHLHMFGNDPRLPDLLEEIIFPGSTSISLQLALSRDALRRKSPTLASTQITQHLSTLGLFSNPPLCKLAVNIGRSPLVEGWHKGLLIHDDAHRAPHWSLAIDPASLLDTLPWDHVEILALTVSLGFSKALSNLRTKGTAVIKLIYESDNVYGVFSLLSCTDQTTASEIPPAVHSRAAAVPLPNLSQIVLVRPSGGSSFYQGRRRLRLGHYQWAHWLACFISILKGRRYQAQEAALTKVTFTGAFHFPDGALHRLSAAFPELEVVDNST